MLKSSNELISFDFWRIKEIHSRYTRQNIWAINKYVSLWYLLKTREKEVINFIVIESKLDNVDEFLTIITG